MENKKHQTSKDVERKTNAMAQRLLQRHAMQPGLISRRKINALVDRHYFRRSPLLSRLQRRVNMATYPQVLRTSSLNIFSKPVLSTAIPRDETTMQPLNSAAAIARSPNHALQGNAGPSNKQTIAPIPVASAREPGSINRVSLSVGHDRGNKPVTAMPNKLLAKIMRGHERISSKVYRKVTISAGGSLTNHKSVSNKDSIVQTPKKLAVESSSMESPQNTQTAWYNEDYRRDAAIARQVDQFKSQANTNEITPQLLAPPNYINNANAKQKFQSQTDSGFGNAAEAASSQGVMPKDRVGGKTEIPKSNDTPLHNRLHDEKPPGGNSQAVNGQGNTALTRNAAQISFRPLPADPVSSSLLTTVKNLPMTSFGSVVVQRRHEISHTSQPMPQALPAKPSDNAATKSLEPIRSDTPGAASISRSERTGLGEANTHSHATDSGVHTVTDIPGKQHFNSRAKTKTTVRQQTSPVTRLSRAIVQRNNRLSKNVVSATAGKTAKPGFVNKQYARTPGNSIVSQGLRQHKKIAIDGSHAQTLANHTIPPESLKAAMLNHVNIPKSDITLDRLTSVEQHADITAASMMQGKKNMSFIGEVNNNPTSVLMRAFNAGGRNYPNTNMEQLPVLPHGSARETLHFSPSVSVNRAIPLSSVAPGPLSIETYHANSEEFPIASRAKDQGRQDLSENNHAFGSILKPPLVKLKTAENRGVQRTDISSTARATNGTDAQQTTETWAGEAASIRSPASTGSSVGTPSPVVNSNTVASQIMQLEQHELEYLAKQVYEIIEDRLELERESMGLM